MDADAGCPFCGRQNRAGQRFCAECGRPLTAEQLPASPPPNPPEPPLDGAARLPPGQQAGRLPDPVDQSSGLGVAAPLLAPLLHARPATARPLPHAPSGGGQARVDGEPPARAAGAAAISSPDAGDALPGAAERASSGRPWAPIAGPVDRTTFFDEQRRHRRATWRFTAVGLFGAAVMGLPLSIVITPLVIGGYLLTAGLISLAAPDFDAIWRPAHAYQTLLAPLQRLGESGAGVRPVTVGELLRGLAALVLPGVLAMMLLWLTVLMAFRRAGVGGVLLTLGARSPRPEDAEERELINVVEEMAIAAGLTPPRVMVLDGPVANAAVIGASREAATVIVSRQLLDDFDRDETQGVLAHLIGSAGNGDLGILLRISALIQTMAVVESLGDALFMQARAAAPALALLRFFFTQRDAMAADAVAGMLGRSLTFGGGSEQGRGGGWRDEPFAMLLMKIGIGVMVTTIALFLINILLYPGLIPAALSHRVHPWITPGLGVVTFLIALPMIGVVWIFLRLALVAFLALLVQPAIALMWRSRRYLADATAVQLTRYPDGVARGLARLAEEGGVPPGGRRAEHLFIVGNEVVKQRVRASRYQARALSAEQRAAMTAQWRAFRERHAGASMLEFPRLYQQFLIEQQGSGLNRAEVARYLRDQEQGALGGESGGPVAGLGVLSFHPKLWRRQLRLKALGATMEVEDWSKADRRDAIQTGCMLIALFGVMAGVIAFFAFASSR